jgi:hypothetical protein
MLWLLLLLTFERGCTASADFPQLKYVFCKNQPGLARGPILLKLISPIDRTNRIKDGILLDNLAFVGVTSESMPYLQPHDPDKFSSPSCLLPLNISISRLEFLKICNVEHL